MEKEIGVVLGLLDENPTLPCRSWSQKLSCTLSLMIVVNWMEVNELITVDMVTIV